MVQESSFAGFQMRTELEVLEVVTRVKNRTQKELVRIHA